MVQKNQDREGEVLVLEYEVPVPPKKMEADDYAEFSRSRLSIRIRINAVI
jgi:hypothetical protein